MKLTHRILLAFALATGFAIGAYLFGLAVALAGRPDGWVYIPVGCASVGWTFGFTLGFAYNHSPTEETTPSDIPIVERKENRSMVPDGVGGWLLVEQEEITDGQRQSEGPHS
jgi:hypothetical protein